MLFRSKNIGRAFGPALLCALVSVLAGLPASASAQSGESVGQSAKLLFVPVQRSADVPEGVPGRVEEYLRALIEIDPKIRMVQAPREADVVAEPAGPAAEPPKAVLEPLPTPPEITRAVRMVEAAKADVQARRFEKALPSLMRARGMFEKKLADLEDFDQYTDCLLWLAVGFIDGGYAEEGADAMGRFAVVRPDASLDQQRFSKGVLRALESAKARAKTAGSLSVVVMPDNASVFVNGRLIGQGNQTVTGLPKGRHFVRVVADGMTTQGKLVAAADKDSKLVLMLQARVAKKGDKKGRAVAVDSSAKPLAWYARTGEFASSGFARDARSVAEKQMADFVVLGYLARSDVAFHLGVFVFDARKGEVVGLEPTLIDTDLGNLQIALLEMESRISAAVSGSFPRDRIVKARPALYDVALTRVAPTPVPTPTPVATPVPTPTPAPTPTPVAVTPAPTPASTPTYVPPAYVPPRSAGTIDEIPSDFPMENAPPPPPRPGSPWYKKWWVWTIAGAVVAGAGATTAIMMTRGGGGSSQFNGKAIW